MKLRWTRRALGDLQRLADRIAQDKPIAAVAFVEAILDKAAMLEEQPLLGRAGSLEDTRELVVHKNYLLTYRLRGDEIQLLQIWHVSRQAATGRS
jgi:addiction module RelE/StbE family toxin